jgi:hypothetical protein
MRRRFALVVLCLAALVLVWPSSPALADSAFTVDAKLTYLGNLGENGQARYRFDYTLINNTITPDLGSFQVFFNSDPVTQAPTGDRATLVSYASPLGWEYVDVYAKNGYGQWSLNWNWDYASGVDVVPGASLSGFSVVFDWNDPNMIPPVQLAQARNGSAHDGVTLLPLSVIAGTVTGACGGSPVGLLGVTVDLYAVDALGQDVLVASTATNASGQFSFANLGIGNYEVYIVTPLGYLADANSKPVVVNETGVTFPLDFALTCQQICAEPRTIGYWKHQVNVYLTGKGNAQETLSGMVGYIDLILQHFNQNITNPVIVFTPDLNDDGTRNLDKDLRKLDQLLTVNNGGTMLDRAKQQMLALLFNVVSGKIAQTQVISPDGATVSQAITYANTLMLSGVRSNQERAKDICDTINNGATVPSGWIPIGTPVITYNQHPTAVPVAKFELAAAAPNPSRGGVVSIGFSLARPDRVDLRLFDVAGRVVKSLASGSFTAGEHRVTWDGAREDGARVQPGVYFYRLVTEEGILTRSITLQR